MRYRKLDQNGDMQFGRGQINFFRDVPEAVAQAVRTRLMMWEGEWFLDIEDGTKYKTEILGHHTQSTRDLSVQERILGTTGLLSLDRYSSSFGPDDRSFSVSATVTTEYGPAIVQEAL